MKRILLLIVAALCLSACGTTKKSSVSYLLDMLAAYDYYRVIEDMGCDLIGVIKDGKVGVVDYQGNIVVPVQYMYITNYPMLKLIAAQLESGTIYFYSVDGKLLSSYADVYEASEEEFSSYCPLISLQKQEENQEVGRIGIVGKSGKLVQPFRFIGILEVMDSSCYTISDADSLFILDAEGRIVRSTDYFSIFKDEAGHYFVENKERLESLFDDDWHELLPCQYKDVSYYPQYGYYVVRDTADVSHLLRSDLTPLPLSANGSVVPIGHSLFAVYHDNTTSLIHLDGRIEQTSYKYIYEEKSWLIAIDNDNTYYLLDSNANPIVKLPTKCGSVSPIDSNHAMIYDDDAYVIIDRRGQQLVRYDDMVYNLGCSCDPEYANFIAVSRDGRWGYIDKHCNEIVSPQYNKAYSSLDDKLCVIYDDGTSALLDSTGHVLITAEGLISEFMPGIYIVHYYEDGSAATYSYLILPDGRTNATPEQRDAARRFNQSR